MHFKKASCCENAYEEIIFCGYGNSICTSRIFPATATIIRPAGSTANLQYFHTCKSPSSLQPEVEMNLDNERDQEVEALQYFHLNRGAR